MPFYRCGMLKISNPLNRKQRQDHKKARAARQPAHPHVKSIQHQWRLLHKSKNSLTTVTRSPDKYKGAQNWPVSVKNNPQKNEVASPF